MRETIEKEYERVLEEEKSFPLGTVKLTEIERINILNKLNEKKLLLIEEIAKFPISTHVRSVKIQKNKLTVENKLNELENLIKMFQRNKVFLNKN